MNNDARSPVTTDPSAYAADQALLERFYAAFAKRDYKGMSACYHPSVSFRDPIFKIEGKKVSAMWHMLCEGGKTMRIEASGISAADGRGRAHWVAKYDFSATGRKVVNAVDSTFTFKDGLILDERDDFSFWNWSRQALGPAGLFLGWMPRLLQTVQEKANGNLEKFLAAHPEYGD
jgi:ketosteroid isomerase-like protein